MQLSQHDLRQLDRDAICGLPLESLQALTLKRLADGIELHERLNQNPANSSRPPSSQAPWEGSSGSEPDGDDETVGGGDPANAKDLLEAEGHDESDDEPVEGGETDENSPRSDPKKPGRPGKRKGAPGYGRRVELAVTAEQVHRPSECTRCGAAFSPDNPSRAYTARYEIDLIAPASGSPGLELFQTKHIHMDSQCSCGHWSRAEPGRCEKEDGWRVELTEWHLVGPMLVALICALSLRMRISRRGIREFLADWLGVKLCIGCINQCIHEAGRAVEPVVQRDIIPEIREAQLAHGDETGWKQGKELLWLWVFTCVTATVFCLGRRSRKIVHDWDAIWAVLDYPWLALTNNAAEQALRHWIIARRISFGTRTAEGSMAFTLLASVIETCRQRIVSPWPYLAEVVRQRRKGEPAPVLPKPQCRS